MESENKDHFHIAICGVGVSGKILSDYLKLYQPDKKVLLLDSGYHKDRRLMGYWGADEHEPIELIESSSAISTIDRLGNESVHQLSKYKYKYFYTSVWNETEHTHVESIKQDHKGFSIETDKGTYHADRVFSSINQNALKRRKVRDNVQFFHGVEIITDTEQKFANPVFMDFRVFTGKDFCFAYLIPLEGRRIFVHLVNYQKYPSDEDLKNYIENILNIRKYQIVRVEKGCTLLTMRKSNVNSDKGISNIGKAGGMINPATGYGINNFIQFSKKYCKEGLLTSPNVPRFPFTFMFQLMMIIINYYPRLAVRMFEGMNRIEPYDILLDFTESKSGYRGIFKLLKAIISK